MIDRGHRGGKRILCGEEVRQPAPSRYRRLTRSTHAFPDHVLHGHVEHVASLQSRWEWLLTGVNVYPTEVALDGPVPGLKPGMVADLTILVDGPLEHVLTVPVEAVVGPAKRGEPGRCFVLTPCGPQEREIVAGLSNETMVEIKSGLREAEEVVLNPEVLLDAEQEKHTPEALRPGAWPQGRVACTPAARLAE